MWLIQNRKYKFELHLHKNKQQTSKQTNNKKTKKTFLFMKKPTMSLLHKIN